jgi:hypothetical protein
LTKGLVVTPVGIDPDVDCICGHQKPVRLTPDTDVEKVTDCVSGETPAKLKEVDVEIATILSETV